MQPSVLTQAPPEGHTCSGQAEQVGGGGIALSCGRSRVCQRLPGAIIGRVRGLDQVVLRQRDAGQAARVVVVQPAWGLPG